MTKRFKTCILHIGTEKTGTSTIQNFLDTNRKALLKDGIFYPDTPFSRFGSQWEFVAISHPHPWIMDVGKACNIQNADDHMAFRQEFSDNLEKQFAKYLQATNLLLSSEHFHSRLLSVGTIKALKDFLDPWVENFKIIVYLRRQDELAVSHYTTQIKSGATTKELILPTDGPRQRYYDYKWIYRIWSEVFGEPAMSVRLYNPTSGGKHGILEEFCALTNIPLSDKKKPIWLNQSVNADGLGLIYALHHKKPKITAKQIEACLQYIVQNYTGKYYPITQEQARLFYAQFIDGNEFVKQHAFPDRDTALFHDDFSKYPHEREPLPIPDEKKLRSVINEALAAKKSSNLLGLFKRLRPI